MTPTDKLMAIGNAIRSKTEDTELLSLDAMPEAINGITIQRTGGPVILADSSGAKWRLTVGTDGTLTTEAVTE